jgi:hypothetical protein
MPDRPSEQSSNVSPPAQIDEGEVHLHGFGRSERLEDDVVVLEGIRLLLGELPRLDELVDQGLIAGDLVELALPQHVAAAVAHLRDEQPGVHQGRDGGRGAHAAAGSVRAGFAEDAGSRVLHGGDQPTSEVVVGPRPLLGGESLEDDVHGQLARDLARGGAAHAVADPKQRPAGTDDLVAILLLEAAGPPGQVGHEEVSSLCSRICPTSVRPKT